MGDLDFTFLVAERAMTLRNAQVENLKDMGFTRVMAAAIGTQAWSMLKRTGADFIICGWNLPEISGLTLLKIVRADKQYLTVPFLMVAELVTKGQVVEAGEAGVTDIICRPITPQRQEAESAYQKGLRLMEQGKWEEALAAFRRIWPSTRTPRSTTTWATSTPCWSATTRPSTNTCGRCASAPQDENIFYNLGRCYYDLGDDTQAGKVLKRAVEISPKFEEAQKLLKAVEIRLASRVDS